MTQVVFLFFSFFFLKDIWKKSACDKKNMKQGAHPSGKSQGNLIFLQGQGKVREFCKMVREIRKSSKVREKSGNFKIMLC